MIEIIQSQDVCSSAVSVPSDGSCNVLDLTGMNDNWIGEVGCATSGGSNSHRDVWISFVATGSTLEIEANQIGLNSTLEVILVSSSGNCAGFGYLSSWCGASIVNSGYTGLSIGETYYLTVSAPSNNEGTFEICVETYTLPSVNNQDCSSAIEICENSAFNGNSQGFGSSELNGANRGCLSIEHQSSWYLLNVLVSGDLEMIIEPFNGTDDYDFAIWGPNVTCPVSGNPVRCSYSALDGTTGMMPGNVDVSEGVFGNKFVRPLSVTVGETYILLIDNFTSSSNPFAIEWGGTAELGCLLLDSENFEFFGISEEPGINKIVWNFNSIERAKNLQRSSDAIIWQTIESLSKSEGVFYDSEIFEKTYYRIQFEDSNSFSKMIVIENSVKSLNEEIFYDYLGRRIPDISNYFGLFFRISRYGKIKYSIK